MELLKIGWSLFLRLKQALEPDPHPVVTGFCNIPWAMDWTLLFYIGITYFKCLVVFGGVKYHHLQFPLSAIAHILHKILFEYCQIFTPKKKAPKRKSDEESLFIIYECETQICLLLLVFLATFLPIAEFLLDLLFLSKSMWRIVNMYRNCPGRFHLMCCSLFFMYKTLEDVIVGVSVVNLVSLYVLIIICTCFGHPVKLHLDAVVYYGCLIFYVTFMASRAVLDIRFQTIEEIRAFKGPSFIENFVNGLIRFYNVKSLEEAEVMQDTNEYVPAWIY